MIDFYFLQKGETQLRGFPIWGFVTDQVKSGLNGLSSIFLQIIDIYHLRGIEFVGEMKYDDPIYTEGLSRFFQIGLSGSD